MSVVCVRDMSSAEVSRGDLAGGKAGDHGEEDLGDQMQGKAAEEKGEPSQEKENNLQQLKQRHPSSLSVQKKKPSAAKMAGKEDVAFSSTSPLPLDNLSIISVTVFVR